MAINPQSLAADEPAAELDLRDYVLILSRRRGVVILAFIAVVGAAMAATFVRTPVYEADARLLLQAKVAEQIFDPERSQQRDADRAVETEIELVESKPVQRAVKETIGRAPAVSASQVGSTDVIKITARHTDPEQAAIIANAYARAYIEFRREQTVQDLLDAGSEIQEKIDALEADIQTIDGQLDTAAAAAAAEGTTVDEETLRSQRSALVTQQSVFRQQLDQLQVGAALRTGGAQLVTPAEAPTEPAEPRPVRTLALAMVVAAMFGVGLAFLFEYMDDSVRDDTDLTRSTGGLPVLGLIPEVAGWKRGDAPYLVSVVEPDSSAAEAYRGLRTAVQFLGIDRTFRTIQVTSALSQEGKTTTVANLGVLFARAGHRVVVVDCDLRRPRVHEFFGQGHEVGFTSVLLGELALSEAVRTIEDVPRLSILSSGPVPPLPSELLQSARAGEVLASLASEFDLVLVDSPPVLPVTDASILGAWVDGTIMVATAGSTSRRGLHRATEALRQVNAPLMGSVLNQASAREAYGYAYGYHYGYAPRTPTPNGDKPKRSERRRQRKEAERLARRTGQG